MQNKPSKQAGGSIPGRESELPKKVRIIGGIWRSRLLSVMDVPGLRPSTDRIRETLFNWLGQDLTGLHCLDLFAGSGALGFEAASRRAHSVVLLEKDKRAATNLQKNLTSLQSSPVPGLVTIRHQDSLDFLKQQASQVYNLIFIDPPFQDGALLEKAVVQAGRICDDSAGGGIYVEFPSMRAREDVEAWLPDWHCGKYLEAGQVKACLFRRRRD